VVTVEDDGVGIPNDVLSRLFDPFVTTKEAKGVGLGLAISRSIVERHEGQISVWSEPGCGTKFTITLPCVASVIPSRTDGEESGRRITPPSRSLALSGARDDKQEVLV